MKPQLRARAPFEVAPAEPVPSAAGSWEPPRFEVISLDCEITSYAPDDQPLF